MTHILHDIKPMLQPTNVSCGQTAVAMLLGHYGVYKTPKEVIEWVKYVDADGNEIGSVTPQLAIKIMELGFRAELYTFDFLLINHDWKNLDGKELIQKLKSVRSTRKVNSPISGYEEEYFDAYIGFVEKGGRLHIRDYPTTELLLGLLRDGPIVVNIVQDVLTGKGWRGKSGLRQDVPDDNGQVVTHSVVVYGFDDGKFLIADPWNGELAVDSEALLAAISIAQIESDNMLFQIKPKEE